MQDIIFTQNPNEGLWVTVLDLDLYSYFMFSHREKSGKYFSVLYAAEEVRNIKPSSYIHTARSLCPCSNQ